MFVKVLTDFSEVNGGEIASLEQHIQAMLRTQRSLLLKVHHTMVSLVLSVTLNKVRHNIDLRWEILSIAFKPLIPVVRFHNFFCLK